MCCSFLACLILVPVTVSAMGCAPDFGPTSQVSLVALSRFNKATRTRSDLGIKRAPCLWYCSGT